MVTSSYLDFLVSYPASFAESVESSGDQYDVFLPFDPVRRSRVSYKASNRLVSAESGESAFGSVPRRWLFVLGEIHQNVRLHVVVGNRNPVVFPNVLAKA